MDTISAALPQIKAYLFAYQHLTDDTALSGQKAIIEYVEQAGCIQYDPLNVVGRNADLVLQSRINGYTNNDIVQPLYGTRELFDVWDKNMSICCIQDWKRFSFFRSKYVDWCEKYADDIEQIREYLLQHDYACSSDIKMDHKVDWYYGPQRFAKAALEGMCYAGQAIVHHKKNNRRYYGLAERYVPQDLFNADEPFENIDEYYEWVVLRRINSVGALWNKASDVFLGIPRFKAADRNRAFDALSDKGVITKVYVDGLKTDLYIDSRNAELLQMCKQGCDCESMRILAPLDNLLWDRKLIKQLFGFDYKWEVYTPIAQRKYGYYVLPLTYGCEFAGRIEFEKTQDGIGIKNVWYEESTIVDKEFEDKFNDCIKRFKQYLNH